MKGVEKERALELRIKYQMGYSAIRKQVKVSKGTLSIWLKDLPLSDARILELRREAWGRGIASRELFRQTMQKKREERERIMYAGVRKKFSKISKQSLYIAGLMLYLAEGSKQNKYAICLANTDPKIITFFMWWMETFMTVSRSEIRGQLHLYESMDIKKEKDFWCHELGLKPDQFYKDQIRKLRSSSFSYAGSHRHGTCQIYHHSGEKKTELMLSIKAFFDTYRGLRA